MEKTDISWTECTWNPWIGCPKKLPGCKFCYMYRNMRRYDMEPTVVRRTNSAAWKQPLKLQEVMDFRGESF
jgi:protein gp37